MFLGKLSSTVHGCGQVRCQLAWHLLFLMLYQLRAVGCFWETELHISWLWVGVLLVQHEILLPLPTYTTFSCYHFYQVIQSEDWYFYQAIYTRYVQQVSIAYEWYDTHTMQGDLPHHRFRTLVCSNYANCFTIPQTKIMLHVTSYTVCYTPEDKNTNVYQLLSHSDPCIHSLYFIISFPDCGHDSRPSRH